MRKNVKLESNQIFRVLNPESVDGKKVWDRHRIDGGGNHFINRCCVNPTEESERAIGCTYPYKKDRVYPDANGFYTDGMML